MLSTKAYASRDPKSPLGPLEIQRREPGPNDVHIQIQYCGVCHSDLHTARDEWGGAKFPVVPGHEIIGTVVSVGKKVKKFKKNDLVGVGCLVGSCGKCASCKENLESYCEKNIVWTYNSQDKDGTITYGGYSTQVVVDQHFVLKVPKTISPAAAAPLLCAGITTYSPLKHWKVKRGSKVAVIGLGGLGHMAVKLAKALGAEVTIISQSLKKQDDGKRLGAKYFYASSDESTFEKLAGRFDLILNTVSAELDLNKYLELLKRDGTMVILGIPSTAPTVEAFSLIGGRRRLSGSLVGGLKETQEMLNFCGKHKIGSDIEVIPMQDINDAYERMLKGDVRYRFVIDMNSLK